MSIPSVTCGADVVVAPSSSPQTISLTATATGSPTSWRWDILHVPPGSLANIGTKGNFTDGIATIQNPTLEIDASIDGGYCIQCRATNSDGQSDPTIDKGNGQQLIIVRVGTSAPVLELPPDYAYDWGEKYNNPNLRAIKTAISGIVPDAHDVKASPGDTSPGYLSSKLVEGANITLTTLDPSGNAQIRISSSGGGGGGLSPIFQWNGTDLSEFAWEYGDQVSEMYSNIGTNVINGINVIEIDVALRGTSGTVATITNNGDGTATVFSSSAQFRTCDINKSITISGSIDPNNDGTFVVTDSSYEYITYNNTLASTETPISATWELTVGTTKLDYSIMLIPIISSIGNDTMIVADILFGADPVYLATNVMLASRFNYSWVDGALNASGYGLVFDSSSGVESAEINTTSYLDGISPLNLPIPVSWGATGSGSRLMHASASGDTPLIYENGPDFRFVQPISALPYGNQSIIISGSGALVYLFNVRVFEITNPASVSTGRWY